MATVELTARPGNPQLRTTCGRVLTVGRLALGEARHPAHRISLDLGNCPGCEASAWAGLTLAEARELAALLLSQAAAAERAGDHDVGAAGRIDVGYVGGDVYAITVRGHTLLTDQPFADGGRDAAPTPTELLAASLTSCVAFYVGRYLRRHALDATGLAVTGEFSMAQDRPARVGSVQLRIDVPGGVPPERRDALLAVASHCTVHNTLRQPPDVSITLAPDQEGPVVRESELPRRGSPS